MGWGWMCSGGSNLAPWPLAAGFTVAGDPDRHRGFSVPERPVLPSHGWAPGYDMWWEHPVAKTWYIIQRAAW
jgi:hypothetical protein